MEGERHQLKYELGLQGVGNESIHYESISCEMSNNNDDDDDDNTTNVWNFIFMFLSDMASGNNSFIESL